MKTKKVVQRLVKIAACNYEVLGLSANGFGPKELLDKLNKLLTRHSVLKDTGFDLEMLWNMPAEDRAWIDKSMAKRISYRIGYDFGKITY